jgi:hypothetical protein
MRDLNVVPKLKPMKIREHQVIELLLIRQGARVTLVKL